MRLAIIADWLTTYGGAEHVLSAFSALWPDAPLYTSVVNRKEIGPLKRADVRPSCSLQAAYNVLRKHQILLPWMPRAFERIDLSDYEIVLSSSHAVAKGIIPSSRSIHICYCHTPMRYAWEMEEQYLDDFRVRGFLRKKVKAELKRLRRWDLTTSKRVDHFIANSTETQARIKRIYGRESVVIPPPVDDRFFQIPLHTQTSNLKPQAYFFAFGRLVPYKRFDLLIELANHLKLPLKIGGTGSDAPRLKQMAGPTVEFLGFVESAKLPELSASAEALLFPQVEDAGIVPMEAQACGTPVVGFGAGGILDVVREGKTGILVPKQTVESFETALQQFQTTRWDRAAIREHAQQFHEEKFKERMKKEIEKYRR